MVDMTGVIAKYDRATHFADELVSEIQAYWARSPMGVVVFDDEEAGMRRWVVGPLKEPPPISVPLAFGDYIHNLRSSLDHLAWLMTPSPDRSTSFPIWAESKGVQVPSWQQFDDLIDRTLGAVSKAVRDELHATEPWFGGAGELIRSVHYLDIVDKHRLVIPIALEVEGVTMYFPNLLPAMADMEPLGMTLVPADRGPLVPGFEVLLQPLSDPTDWKPKFHFGPGLAEPAPVARKRLSDAIDLMTNAVLQLIQRLEVLL